MYCNAYMLQQGDPLAPALFSLGLHCVIEQLTANPDIRQIWFLDDGIVHCHSLSVMTRELAKIDLHIHLRKCEIYLPVNSSSPAGFGSIPVVRDRDMWSYLGTPLCEQTAKALNSAQRRVKQAIAKLISFAKKPHRHGN